jgi:hypothetical protein cdivTM_28108
MRGAILTHKHTSKQSVDTKPWLKGNITMTTITLNGKKVEAHNYTPHALNIHDLEGNEVIATIPSSGMVRVAETVHTVSDGEGEVPLVEIVRDPTKLEGLPEEKDGHVVIVSDITYQAALPLGRKDLLRAGPAVRDESGRIIGCKGLAL